METITHDEHKDKKKEHKPSSELNCNMNIKNNDNVQSEEVMVKKSEVFTKGDPSLQWENIENVLKLTSCTCKCGWVYKRKDFSLKGYKKLRNGYYNHYREKHQSKVHMLKCHECPRVLENDEERDQHIKQIHERHQMKCTQCEYKTPVGLTNREAKARLDSHVFSKHIKEKRNVSLERPLLKCHENDCNYATTKSKGHLDQHYKRKHVLKKCPECGVEVKILYAHMQKKHKQDFELTIRCDQCGKGFTQQNYLTRHVAIVHQGKRFHCRYPDCVKKAQPYRDSSNRDAHERVKHGGSFTKYQAAVEIVKRDRSE